MLGQDYTAQNRRMHKIYKDIRLVERPTQLDRQFDPTTMEGATQHDGIPEKTVVGKENKSVQYKEFQAIYHK